MGLHQVQSDAQIDTYRKAPLQTLFLLGKRGKTLGKRWENVEISHFARYSVTLEVNLPDEGRG